LSLLGGFPPPSPNMAPLSTGSAHTPSSGYKTIKMIMFNLAENIILDDDKETATPSC
jgi:hypothetical protein